MFPLVNQQRASVNVRRIGGKKGRFGKKGGGV